MSITIKQIAEIANVSIGTVDRVLHNRGRYSQDTADRIHRICEEHGYSSNVVGKAMAMQKAGKVVAVVVNARNRNIFSEVIHEGLEQFALSVKDYNVRFEFYDIFDNTISEMSRILDHIYEKDIDGLIIKPLESQVIRYKLMRFSEKNIPLVFCTADMSGIDTIAYVGQNHFKLGRMLACTLSRVTFGKIKLLIVVAPMNASARREKLDGFISYLKDSNREFEICNICEVPFDDDVVKESLREQLDKHSDINSLYVHLSSLKPCMEVMESYSHLNIQVFTYAQEEAASQLIKDGKISFAVYEDPFRQGYVAGEVMFNYLLNANIPEGRKKIMDGQIVFDENC